MDSAFSEKTSKHDEVVHEVVYEGGGQSSETLTVTVDPEMERRCMKKFDLWLMPQLVILIILGYLDRSNIGNARVMGLEADLGLTGSQFNNIASVFFVTYSLFGAAWALTIKAIGANRALAITMVAWSAITIGTGFCRNYHDLVACRILLGVFESALLAANAVIIGNIYPRTKQAKRMAAVPYGVCVSGAFGGLIAYAVQVMGARHGLASWRWLFVIEGAVSLLAGAVCWVSLPVTPETAWFLTREERATMVAIRERDAAYRGKEKFEKKYLRIAMLDPVLWLVSATGFVSALPLVGFGLFAPTLILGMGYSRLQANYLSVPLYVVATIALALSSWLSDKLRRRAVMTILPSCCAALGYAVVLGNDDPRVGFMAMFFVAAGIHSLTALHLSWYSNNMAPDSKRTVAMPIIISFTIVSGIMSAQIYPTSDGPRYMMGNAISLGGSVAAGCGALFLWLLWRRRNALKSKLIAEGATVNKYADDRALGFQYVL